MITFLLDKNSKALLRTTNTRIYQNEAYVDTIQFIFPKEYEGQELKDFTFTVSWLDPNEVAHADVLVLKDDDYKGAYLRFTVPVTAKITEVPGFISLKVNVVKINSDGTEEEILKTGSNSFRVIGNTDYETTKDEMADQIKTIQQSITELLLTSAKHVNNIKIVNNGTAIQLVSDGSPVGEPILLTDLLKAQEKAVDDEMFKVGEY